MYCRLHFGGPTFYSCQEQEAAYKEKLQLNVIVYHQMSPPLDYTHYTRL